ncbi:peptidylprolyl isomerase [Alloiococcus sp. CFN-8]|uniref:peptidylprolyl isomerase n=1 Tax=Alloiococcus sp. CFN-8 TaxID=3416081 RepID=UPI003CF43975
MSGSKQKLKRQEERNQGIDKRQLRDKQREELVRKQKKYGIIAGVVTALILALITFFNSNLLYRNFTAVKAGEVEYSIADFNYYYNNLYYSYYNSYFSNYGEYANYMMPDKETIEGDTIKMMEETALLYTQAKETGYELSEAGKKQIESNMDSLKDTAEAAGFKSVKQYLKSYFKGGVNEDIYRQNLEEYTLAMEYGETVLDSNTFSDKELEDYYADNKDKYDVINYRYFFVNGAAVADNEETEENEEVDGETAMAEAKTKADEFLSKITDEESFNKLAYEYADEATKESYSDADATLVSSQGANIDTAYSKWLLENGRNSGDKTVVEVANGYYVLYFISRDNNDYETVNVRHILIKPEEVVKADYEDEEAYKAAQEEALEKAKAEAEELYSQWKNGDATEASFGKLADEHSDDAPAGGLYENVAKGQMVEAFNNWIYDASRKPGDTGIVETNFGYHIMYFVGNGMKYSNYLADTDKKTEAYNKWVEENVGAFKAEEKWPLKFAH